ncbi:uncharacterized protein EAE97_007356 [Botrytis byssoidea]|uniref:LysM domain-containing protein n=1 Tax=Botrytis byssoidea TaxID=139641 RepID=A0A9P5IJ56_9HELO|nr:uncharacterized protein EAE97_007356 [Botrytis byssoidea]KAF7939276.1 hypothetical protein EAE97_007356 [Botrytis byssoidea]
MRQSVFALAALSLWQICTAQAIKETLVPYHPRDLGLQRRDAPPSVTLQSELSLIWGSSNGSTFVNVTLNTGETELVISTEHFADSLTDVQCNGDLVLTFKDNATFQAAISDWSWVNFHENRTFFMINNWGACAAASESGRQPWVVHGVDVYDEQNFIVNFNATLSDWDDVMSGAVIEFGAMSTSSSSKRTDTVSKTLSLNMAHSLPQTFFSKSTNNGLDFSIDCPGCATTGSIDVQGKIVMNTIIGIPTSVKSISITATPKGLGANLALGFSVSGTLGSGWSKDWNLVTVGLPGWSIPKIIDLGPQFSVDAGFALSGIEGSASISAGVNVAIPDSSSAVLGISGVDSSFKGWVPTATPQTPKVSVEVDGSLQLYTELGLDVGLTVLSKWGFGGGLFLRIPDVKIDLGAEFNTQGVCPGSADVFGVTLGATVGVDLNLGVYTESGGDKSWKAKTSIYANNNLITPIDKCFPLGPTLPAGGKGVSIKTVGTVPVSSANAVSTTKAAATTSAKVTSAGSSSKASAVSASTTHKTSGSASATSIKVSGTGASSSIKVSGTIVPSSIKVSGTGPSSSKITGTGISGYGTSKIVGTAVSSSAHGYGSAPASSSALGYGTAPVYSTSTKLSGTGVSSSSKVTGTGVSSAASYGTHPDTTASSIKGASTSIVKTSGTVVISSSVYISASGVSSVKTAIGSSATSALGLETSKASSSSAKVTTTAGAPVYGGSSTSSALGLETSKVSSIAASSTSSALSLETSKASSSSAKVTTTAGASVYGGSSTSSALGLETSKVSSIAASSTKVSSTVVASSTTTKASATVIPTKTATGTVAPAPTATGTISTCDKWVTIEDNSCSCTNIENYYGVSAANLNLWNPALGSECKLTVGQAVCIGVKGAYKRSVNGRLARFVDV